MPLPKLFYLCPEALDRLPCGSAAAHGVPGQGVPAAVVAAAAVGRGRAPEGVAVEAVHEGEGAAAAEGVGQGAVGLGDEDGPAGLSEVRLGKVFKNDLE